jgi:hypothetical protein
VNRLGEFLPNGRSFTLNSFYKKLQNWRKILAYFFSLGSIDYVIILTIYWLGYILGDFFTISSGHPGQKLPARQEVIS